MTSALDQRIATDRSAEELRETISAPRPVRKIARSYNVSAATISRLAA